MTECRHLCRKTSTTCGDVSSPGRTVTVIILDGDRFVRYIPGCGTGGTGAAAGDEYTNVMSSAAIRSDVNIMMSDLRENITTKRGFLSSDVFCL